MDKKGRCLALERTHVHDVYAKTAHHFQDSRYKAWPRVRKFLADLEPGSLVADVGCGTGKYLHINRDVFKFGSDHCERLVNIAHQRHHEVMVCDNLRLPYRDSSFDAVISIGVIHHMTSRERRVNALKELARILRPGGKVMIYVWAMEQKHRKFDAQDVLVPWHFQPKNPRKNDQSSIKRTENVDERNSGKVAFSRVRGQAERSLSLPSTPSHHQKQYLRKSDASRTLDVSSKVCPDLEDDIHDRQSHLWQRSQFPRNPTRQGVQPLVSMTMAPGENCIGHEELKLECPRRKRLGKEDHSNSFPNVLKEKFLNLFGNIGGSPPRQESPRKGKPSNGKDLEYRDLIRYIMQEEADLFSNPRPLLEHSMSAPETGDIFMVREFPQSSQPSLLKQQATDIDQVSMGTENTSSHPCDTQELTYDSCGDAGNCDKLEPSPCTEFEPTVCQTKQKHASQKKTQSAAILSHQSQAKEETLPKNGCSSLESSKGKTTKLLSLQGQVYSEDSSGFDEDLTDESEGDLVRNPSSTHSVMAKTGCECDHADVLTSRLDYNGGSANEVVPKFCHYPQPFMRDEDLKYGSCGSQIQKNRALISDVTTGCDTTEATDNVSVNRNTNSYVLDPQDVFGAISSDNLDHNLHSPPEETSGQSAEQCNTDQTTISFSLDTPPQSASPESGSGVLESESETEEWARTTAQVIRSMQSQMLKNAKGQMMESNLPRNKDQQLGSEILPREFSDRTDVGIKEMNGSANYNGKHAFRRSSESLSISSDAYSDSASEVEDNGAFEMCECGTECGFRRTLSEGHLEKRPPMSPSRKPMRRAGSEPGTYETDDSPTTDKNFDSTEPQGTYHRYYHVFKEGELVNLIEGYVDCLHVLQSYYDHANWCVVAEKVQVWTL